MEGGFQSLLITGKYVADDDNFSPVINSDEAYINRDMTFNPLSYEKARVSSVHCPYDSSYDILDRCGESWKQEDSKWRFKERAEKVKRLKNEPSNKPFNFNPTLVFNQLPELQSMEQANRDARTDGNPHMLEPTVSSFLQLTANYLTPAPLLQIPPPAKMSHKVRRRNTLSDKARSLQKVLPWDKKMDMATIYEETFKYIKFLQAQITVLESMPVASSNFGSENPRHGNIYGVLGKLNRQQLLEVVVNSHAAQTMLYTKGCCIYSMEQLVILFKNITEKNFFISDPSIFS